MNRRRFLQSGAAAGAGLLLGAAQDGAQAASPSGTIDVALIGVGERGHLLMHALIGIPDLRVRAICDIWPYRRNSAQNFLEIYRHTPAQYADYREMLQKEKGLKAAIIATPDFAHAAQAVACMEAGLHVYCEKPMAESVEAARAMVRTMRRTGRLLQIGYQRRSNPRYVHVRQKLFEEARLPGRVTHVASQWVHPLREDAGWPRRFALPEDQLRQHGYGSMQEFRNWRHYRKYSAGLFADMGIHQVDVTNWLLGARPKSVFASGGLDYHKDREWPDNIMAVAEYEAPEGLVRATHQVLTTTSAGGGPAEAFLGVEATVRISEDPRGTKIFREPYAPDWDRWVALRYLAREQPAGPAQATTQPDDPNAVRVRETGQLVKYDLPLSLEKTPAQYHLENFFDAIRGQAKLTCPADVAFGVEAAIWKVNQSIARKQLMEFVEQDFMA